jgi:hypothetical protein
LHGVVMLQNRVASGELGEISREELVEEFVDQTKLALSVAIEAAGKNG